MATRHRIDDALRNVPMGDVEKYFTEVNNMVENNSGVHDCKMVSHDCDNTSAPFKAGSFTKFKLTDRSMDIVDMSKGYIALDIEFDVRFDWNRYAFADGMDINWDGNLDGYTGNMAFYEPIFFIGFKSAAHIIEVYNVYSNGVLTNCKQVHAKEEQVVTYMSKSQEEREGRPGMYTTDENVKEMSDCICGVYIRPPGANNKDAIQRVKFTAVIQVDDLLPFSSWGYYPRFLCGDLELQISTQLAQNVVFCQLPYETSWTKCISRGHGMPNIEGNPTWKDAYIHELILNAHHGDFRFHSCGDYIESICPYYKPREGIYDNNCLDFNPWPVTLYASNMTIQTAKSYIYGFDIKESVKQNLINMYGNKNLVLPCQTCEHYTFSQLPGTTNIRANMQLTMNNASQLILTFPRTPNELVTSRNPHLEAIQCQVGNRIVPDKFFSTLDKAHSEMIIANLNFDSLFTAPKSLIEALTRNRGRADSKSIKIADDSDYMLVINLERFGSNTIDGMSGVNIPINFQANYMEGTANPHFYELRVKEFNTTMLDGPYLNRLAPQHINVFVISDAFWVCNSNGCQFVKDISIEN